MIINIGNPVMPRFTNCRLHHLVLPLVMCAAPALAVQPPATHPAAHMPGGAAAEPRPANALIAQVAPAESGAAETKVGAPKAAEAKAEARQPASEAKPSVTKGSDAGVPAAGKVDPGPLALFAWLDGCWRGSVNQREFREHWLPLRGNLMLGVSHTVRGDQTQNYEYLRIENRPEGTFYVNQPSGIKAKENAYKFAGRTLDTSDGRNDEVYTFENAAVEFPQRITYRRGTEGWLYATVEGMAKGVADHKVIYPMRRIDCQSGEFIRK